MSRGLSQFVQYLAPPSDNILSYGSCSFELIYFVLCASDKQQRALEQHLAQLEESCRQKEAERVDLELRLTEVKEKLKKSLTGGVLGAPVESKPTIKVFYHWCCICFSLRLAWFYSEIHSYLNACRFHAKKRKVFTMVPRCRLIVHLKWRNAPRRYMHPPKEMSCRKPRYTVA